MSTQNAAPAKFFTIGKILFITFMLATIAALTGLGNWQVQRLSWKQSLITQVAARIDLPRTALPVPQRWGQMIPENYNFTPSFLHGTYQFQHEVYVFTTLQNPKGKQGGQGVWVMTPLKLDSGPLVYINRGFVPYDTWLGGTNGWDNPTGALTVSGLMRKPELQDIFAPDPNMDTRLFNRRDPRFIATSLNLGEAETGPDKLAPFFIDAAATTSGRLPQGGETLLSFTNNHLQYVVTWYGLALAVLGSLIYWLVLQLRPNRRENQT